MKETLEKSDVVFMSFDPEPRHYEEYGATVSAWGGAHTLERVRSLEELGVHSTGSMWCLTAKAEELHRDADLREATVRDIEGNRIIVPWQTDHTYEGTPTWWGCFNHPSFRAHLRRKVSEVMAGGAKGLHVDDHLGTAHPAHWNGGCFCDHCMAAFRRYLIEHDSSELRSEAGVTDFARFDYRTLVRRFATTRARYLEVAHDIPLHQEFLDCLLGLAAANVRGLKRLAEEIVERPVTVSANAGLPSLAHTTVTPDLTYLVAEVNQHSEAGAANLLGALKAYRMAEAIGKEIAATASGHDWAYAKERGAETLVRVWIALAYACGQRLMVPGHRQWAHTPEKGTHWYDGPTEAYAPLYRFVRTHARLFDGFATVGPMRAPEDVPSRFDTLAERNKLDEALDRTTATPITAGEHVWVFPRIDATGHCVVHLVNIGYDADSDSVAVRRELPVGILPTICGGAYRRATVYSYDRDPVVVALRSEGTNLRFTVPELRQWAVVELER